MPDKNLNTLLDKAVGRRQALRLFTNAVRLVNGKGDGLPGLIIDQYNAHYVLQVFAADILDQVPAIVRMLEANFKPVYCIVKDRTNSASPEDAKHTVVISATSSTTVVEEFGAKFEVNLNDGLNTGLFLDMRSNRHMVAQACASKRMLNCFAYTCSFGVHAHRAGAMDVVNVDISKKILERGRTNYALNHITPGEHEFVRAHAGQYLARAVKKDNRFDTIVIDPPSFARHEDGDFQIKRDLPLLMKDAISIINSDGALFVSTNFNGISHGDLEGMLIGASNGRRFKRIERVGQDKDFPGTNTFKESHLAGLWVKFL